MSVWAFYNRPLQVYMAYNVRANVLPRNLTFFVLVILYIILDLFKEKSKKFWYGDLPTLVI